MVYIDKQSHRWLFNFFFFQAEDGIRDSSVTGVQTCALPISEATPPSRRRASASTSAKASGPPARGKARPCSIAAVATAPSSSPAGRSRSGASGAKAAKPRRGGGSSALGGFSPKHFPAGLVLR